MERQALLIYATEDAGVRTPRLHAVDQGRRRRGRDRRPITWHGTTLADTGAADDRRPAQAGLGHGAAAAQAPGHAPRADRRPDHVRRGRTAPVADPARPGQRRRGRQRPAGPDRPGPADRADRADRRPGPGRRRGDREDGQGGSARPGAAAAAGRALPLDPVGPARQEEPAHRRCASGCSTPRRTARCRRSSSSGSGRAR